MYCRRDRGAWEDEVIEVWKLKTRAETDWDMLHPALGECARSQVLLDTDRKKRKCVDQTVRNLLMSAGNHYILCVLPGKIFIPALPCR